MVLYSHIASFPAFRKGAERERPGDYCMRMSKKLPEKVVIVYYSNLSVTLVSILQDTGSVFYLNAVP